MFNLQLLIFCTLIVFMKRFASGVVNPVFFIEGAGWYNQTHAGYVGHFKIPIHVELPSWWIALIFDHPIAYFEVWQGTILKSNIRNTILYFEQTRWNGHMYPGSVMDQRYHVEFEKQPGVDYRSYYGPRPLIIFLNKVYRPHPTNNHEHIMSERDLSQATLPSDLELLPVLTVTTTPGAVTTTLAPLTPGPNAGVFWWVRTVSARASRPTVATTTTTTVSTTTTSTTSQANFADCQRHRNLRWARCQRLQKPKSQCNILKCSVTDPAKFNTLQCWRYVGICWCVDKNSGNRKKAVRMVRYNARYKLNCDPSRSMRDSSTQTVTTPSLSQSPTSSEATQSLPRPPFAPRNDYDYNLAIRYSLLFFEAQRSGRLEDDSDRRVTWRVSSHQQDGTDCGRDLSGGYYVAGDYIKYSFPAASAMTMLAWGFLEFPRAYHDSQQTSHLKSALKWGADYFIKAHVSRYKLYGQVGLSRLENSFWKRPQDMNVRRPCRAITDRNPGSDLAAETAAAFASTALVWQQTDGEDEYVRTLLDHAKDLYDFATKYRQIYSLSIREAADHYPSSGYNDEIVWAALWLYRATKQRRYLADAGRMYDHFGLHTTQAEVSWEDKTTPVQLLLSRYGPASHAQEYLRPVREFCNYNLPDSSFGAEYTPQGLVYISEWGTTRYACNAAFVCLVASKSAILDEEQKRQYRKFAEDQIDYILGKTGKSYVIGLGKKFPRRPHHRASSCSLSGPCGWQAGYHKDGDNPYLLLGALVGGPDRFDNWNDDRTNFTTNSVSLDGNAGFQGAVAGLRHFQLEYEAWKDNSRGRGKRK